MGTVTRTATLEAATTDAGSIDKTGAVYTHISNPTDPESSWTSGIPDTTILYSWFQFNFNDLGDSDYDNDYISANIIDVTVADFRYSFSTASPATLGSGPRVRSMTVLPVGVISTPSAETSFVDISVGTLYLTSGTSSGAQTDDLGSSAYTDIKTAIQNVETGHDSGTSDNGKWAFGTQNGTGIGNGQFIYDRSVKFFLDITYSISARPPVPKITTVNIIQSTQSTIVSAAKKDETEFIVDGDNVERTQYQIVEGHQTFDNPMINIDSNNTKLRTNGNLISFSKNKLAVILLNGKDYRVRIRTHNGTKWSSWVTKNFKTRDKDYKKA